MKKWFEKILNLLFPPKCPFCAKILDVPGICNTCEQELPWIKDEEVVVKKLEGIRCAAPLWYQEQVRETLLRFKFQGNSAIAGPLGEVIARCAAEQFGGEFDIVTWVPVSKRRLRKRGYDQTELLAQSVCLKWNIRPTKMLRKAVDNPPQSGLRDASARRANVLGVYEAVNEEQIHGKRVLLIDDIYTTGATLTECVRVLKEAGAADVVCVAAARAGVESPKNGVAII